MNISWKKDHLLLHIYYISKIKFSTLYEGIILINNIKVKVRNQKLILSFKWYICGWLNICFLAEGIV